jgi:hypothetical protein
VRFFVGAAVEVQYVYVDLALASRRGERQWKIGGGTGRREAKAGTRVNRGTRQTRLLPAPFDPRRLGQEPDDDDEYEDATKK